MYKKFYIILYDSIENILKIFLFLNKTYCLKTYFSEVKMSSAVCTSQKEMSQKWLTQKYLKIHEDMGNIHKKKVYDIQCTDTHRFSLKIYNVQIFTDFSSKCTICTYFENFGKYTIYSCLQKYVQCTFIVYIKKL